MTLPTASAMLRRVLWPVCLLALASVPGGCTARGQGGQELLVFAHVGTCLVAEITASALRDLELRRGQKVYLIIKANSILVLDAPEQPLTSDTRP